MKQDHRERETAELVQELTPVAFGAVSKAKRQTRVDGDRLTSSSISSTVEDFTSTSKMAPED